jgi:hypothetical protein
VTTEIAVTGISTTRLREVRVLMGLAAVSALAAAIGAIPVVADAGAPTMMTETWRLYGFLTFAGLFVLLGWRPLSYRWLWEIVILNKLLLTVTAGGYVTDVIGPGDVEGAPAALISDGILTAGLVVAYLVCRGWRAGPRRREDPSGVQPAAGTRLEGSP